MHPSVAGGTWGVTTHFLLENCLKMVRKFIPIYRIYISYLYIVIHRACTPFCRGVQTVRVDCCTIQYVYSALSVSHNALQKEVDN